MALPSPGILKTEISQMDAQKKDMLTAREGILSGINELQGKKTELEGNLKELYNQLDQPRLPDEIKPQLLERVNMIKSALLTVDQQIITLQDRIGMLEHTVGSINSGIRIRKNVLGKLAGTVAKQKATQSNREVGRIKG